MEAAWGCMDGNEAAARVAYAASEVIAIYPITPASPMAEHADDWSAAGRHAVGSGRCRGAPRGPSEGRAGHDLHRVAKALARDPEHVQDRRELTPTVIHVAARTIATHALSTFGDQCKERDPGTEGGGMSDQGEVVRLPAQILRPGSPTRSSGRASRR